MLDEMKCEQGHKIVPIECLGLRNILESSFIQTLLCSYVQFNFNSFMSSAPTQWLTKPPQSNERADSVTAVIHLWGRVTTLEIK